MKYELAEQKLFQFIAFPQVLSFDVDAVLQAREPAGKCLPVESSFGIAFNSHITALARTWLLLLLTSVVVLT